MASGPDAAAPRAFRDAAFQRARTDADLRRVIIGGKLPGMPAFGNIFDDQQLDGLVTVIRSYDPERK